MAIGPCRVVVLVLCITHGVVLQTLAASSMRCSHARFDSNRGIFAVWSLRDISSVKLSSVMSSSDVCAVQHTCDALPSSCKTYCYTRTRVWCKPHEHASCSSCHFAILQQVTAVYIQTTCGARTLASSSWLHHVRPKTFQSCNASPIWRLNTSYVEYANKRIVLEHAAASGLCWSEPLQSTSTIMVMVSPRGGGSAIQCTQHMLDHLLKCCSVRTNEPYMHVNREIQSPCRGMRSVIQNLSHCSINNTSATRQ